jgi:hypothetical protein
MGAITEGLLFAFAASAPKIAFSFFDVDCVGGI